MVIIKKIFYIIQISRPINFTITFFSLIVAGLICNENQLNGFIILAAISASLVGSAGNIINDIIDIQIDKVNRPQRILPSNKLTINEAKITFIIFNLTAVVLAYLINLNALLIVIISIVTISSYSVYFKRVALLGNIIVSFFTGLAFIYGGVSVNNFSEAIIPAVFAFLTNLIREIIKDIEDIKGDSAFNVITFPSKFGIKTAKNLVLAITVLLIIFTTIPFILSIYKIEFFIIVMTVINPLFLFMIKILYSSDNVRVMNKCSRITKLNMILGLAAIYLGAL